MRYKDSYCLIRQYMPKKLEKWDVKLWVLADSVIQYVYDFHVYCGKNGKGHKRGQNVWGMASGTHFVVMGLLVELEGRGHLGLSILS